MNSVAEGHVHILAEAEFDGDSKQRRSLLLHFLARCSWTPTLNWMFEITKWRTHDRVNGIQICFQIGHSCVEVASRGQKTCVASSSWVAVHMHGSYEVPCALQYLPPGWPENFPNSTLLVRKKISFVGA